MLTRRRLTGQQKNNQRHNRPPFFDLVGVQIFGHLGRLIGGAQHTLQVCRVGGLLVLLTSSRRHYSVRRERNTSNDVVLC